MPVGRIEKIINGGWGLLREDDKTVLIPFVLPDEEVEYSIKEKAKGIYWGELKSIITPSPKRIEPACPLFGLCGGCVFQNTDYENQKIIKKKIFSDDMKRIGEIEIKPDFFYKSQPFGYRIRGRLKTDESTNKIGFIKKSSHNVIPIDKCLLFTDKMNDYLKEWNSLTNPPFFFQQDIIFDGTNDRTMISLSHKPDNKQIKTLNKFKSVKYLWKGNDNDYASINIDNYKYKVKPSTFFQVNKFQHSNMLKFVNENLFQSRKIIDLYSGVGFFIPLLLEFSKEVIGVESYTISTELAKNSFPIARFINKNVDKFSFESADIIIADPPRSGLSKYVMKKILEYKYRRLIYISCSSATFARDAKILTENGYSLNKVSLMDLFPQTSHIEILSVFDRNDFNE